MEQEYVRRAAVVMTALELLPAQPSDLTGILRNADQFRALSEGNPLLDESDLVGYLRQHLNPARVDYWHKQIDCLVADKVGYPILAGDSGSAPSYPSLLSQCWDAPPVLFSTTTAIERRQAPSIAVIGSRAANDQVLAATRRLSADLASTATIVSGLALGVDSAAHEGALDVGGHTIAVLGTGITRVYPERNLDLARRISSTGALVSQFAPLAPRTKTSFLRRNAVIAGMSDVSIVMAGESRSGSRNEIRHAVDYGRTALMWAPTLEREEWARKLANDGEATFIASAADVRQAIKKADQ